MIDTEYILNNISRTDIYVISNDTNYRFKVTAIKTDKYGYYSIFSDDGMELSLYLNKRWKIDFAYMRMLKINSI